MNAPAPARHMLISSVKDEGPFVLEWVAHHLVLGFDRICMASNDCRDGTERLLDALAAAGYIDHVHNVVAPGEIPQHAGYTAIRAKWPVDQAEWLMVLDADEFLVVQVGAGRVQDLTDRAGPACDIISLHAMCFADAPEVNWRPGRVCALFPWRLALTHKANRAMKSLTRAPRRFRDIHNHSMVGFKGQAGRLQVMDGDGSRHGIEQGVPLWQQLRNGAVHDGSHQLAHYNHYAVKTWDAYNLRRERGRGAVAVTDNSTMRHTDAYFRDRNSPDAKDLSVLRYEAEVVAMMARMMQDDAVRCAHAECERLFGQLAARYRR
jgi:hypothetical protein